MSGGAKHQQTHGSETAATGPATKGFRWLKTGADALAEMLQAIADARHSIRLEMYIFRAEEIGEKFRQALVLATKRGVRVKILLDGFGSYSLAGNYWDDFVAAGGEFRRFNLPGIRRLGLRDHRKLMICDDDTAFIGGMNIAVEYAGDGVRSGWRDLGLHFKDGLVADLRASFDEMFAMADFKHPRFTWLRHAVKQRYISRGRAAILLIAPGWRPNPMVRLLVGDFRQAESIDILCAYFLPTHRLLRALLRAARRGAKVRVILAAQSDMPVMQMAARGLYRTLLRAGVEIHEYAPQILHAKMMIVNNQLVYAGSANLDIRSLHLNYELLLRIEDRPLAQEATKIFQHDLQHSKRIELAEWIRDRRWGERLCSRIAAFLVARLDPYLASHSWRR